MEYRLQHKETKEFATISVDSGCENFGPHYHLETNGEMIFAAKSEFKALMALTTHGSEYGSSHDHPQHGYGFTPDEFEVVEVEIKTTAISHSKIPILHSIKGFEGGYGLTLNSKILDNANMDGRLTEDARFPEMISHDYYGLLCYMDKDIVKDCLGKTVAIDDQANELQFVHAIMDYQTAYPGQDLPANKKAACVIVISKLQPYRLGK